MLILLKDPKINNLCQKDDFWIIQELSFFISSTEESERIASPPRVMNCLLTEAFKNHKGNN